MSHVQINKWTLLSHPANCTLNGEVDGFVIHYLKTQDTINYATLGKHGLPAGGKKPSSRRKTFSKKATSAVKSTLAASDEISQAKLAGKELSL